MPDLPDPCRSKDAVILHCEGNLVIYTIEREAAIPSKPLKKRLPVKAIDS